MRTMEIFKQLNLELDATVERMRPEWEETLPQVESKKPTKVQPEPELEVAEELSTKQVGLAQDEQKAVQRKNKARSVADKVSSKKKGRTQKATRKQTKEQPRPPLPVVNNGKPGADRSWYLQVYGCEKDPRLGRSFRLPDLGPPCRSPLR